VLHGVKMASEIAFATHVVEAFDQAEGVAAMQLDGQCIDYPIVEAAQRLLAMAAGLEQRRNAESAAGRS
jgi:citrate lyase subunit beta / citryl-CoA lyase